MPIGSFKDKDTATLFDGKFVRRFQAIRKQAEKKLQTIDVATTLNALRVLPGNRFEALGGDRAGQYSIRINDQWRLCFRWAFTEEVTPDRDVLTIPGNAEDVEIVDYH